MSLADVEILFQGPPAEATAFVLRAIASQNVPPELTQSLLQEIRAYVSPRSLQQVFIVHAQGLVYLTQNPLLLPPDHD